jgi:hypothetical protein
MQSKDVDKIVNFILFGDVQEAPLDLVENELGLEENQAIALMGQNAEEYWRISIASAIRQEFGGVPPKCPGCYMRHQGSC